LFAAHQREGYLTELMIRDIKACALLFMRHLRPTYEEACQLIESCPYVAEMLSAAYTANTANNANPGTSEPQLHSQYQEITSLRRRLLEVTTECLGAVGQKSLVTLGMGRGAHDKRGNLNFITAARRMHQSPISARVTACDAQDVAGSELIHAVRMNNIGEVRRLVRAAADINYIDPQTVRDASHKFFRLPTYIIYMAGSIGSDVRLWVRICPPSGFSLVGRS
jgi:hypothetical protein